MITGQVTLPSYMALYLAMWLTTWSKVSVTKSPNMISTIGR